MRLSRCERDEIISSLEKHWKYMFQAGFVVPLVSQLQQAVASRTNSSYYGLPNTPMVRLKIERELTEVLENWCKDAAFKYQYISHKLLDKDLFWLKLVEGKDPSTLEIMLSPTILELYNGASSINVFNWTNWSDDSLKNAYDDLVEKGKI